MTKKKEISPKSGKQKRLFDNLVKTVQQFVQGKSFVSSTFSELQQRLQLPDQHKEVLQEVLDHLTLERTLEFTHGRYIFREGASNIVKGVLRLHPRGFGFVTPDDSSYEDDIFIPKHLTQGAVDGDTVEVLVNTESISDKGPEGRVVTILARGRTHLAGIIQQVNRRGSLMAYAPLLGNTQRVVVEADGETLQVGDRIVMEVLDWGTKEEPTRCKFSHSIGHISDPSCDIPAAIEEFELRKDFPTKVAAEARGFGTRVPLSEIRKREDLRSQTCFTIDPDTAKDYDDAISLTKDDKGHYHLGVHIADVSHYVQKGSALDEEAHMRCNSTYFPGRSLPMLPRELSDNLCSLKPLVNRLTISVFIEFDPQGDLVHYRLARSVIKSTKRFTYREAKAVLDGKERSPHAATLKMMVQLCHLLKKKRYERGSIEFGMPELVVLVDEAGMPYQTDYVVYDITHQLVEEFMLKANEIVAWHLNQQGKNLTYRVHDEPSAENLKDFAILAGAFGFQLSHTPTPKEIQELFDEAMKTPYGEYLATSYIRRMRLAIYSPENIGHYGLSLTHYCHFTSPIRRYVDLVVHRILFHEEEEKENLEIIAERCSEQERISSKAENNVVLLKKLRLLELMQKKDPHKQYEAVVTRVKNFGLYFEILELMLESYLHVSELENDYYIYEEASRLLHGRHTGIEYKAGDKVLVRLKEVDLITLDSQWELIPEKAEGRRPKAETRQKAKGRRQKERQGAEGKMQKKNSSPSRKVSKTRRKRK